MSYELVVLGTSLGGLMALKVFLAFLPEDFKLPIVMVQHRGKDPDEGLCAQINRYTKMTIVEAEDKQEIQANHIYLAPPNYHLLIEARGVLALSTEAPVYFARPSIDVLFESAADAYRDRLIGVILTGASRDGADGVKRIKERGGLVIVQDPSSAESAVMPDAAIYAAQVDYILSLDQLGPTLFDLTR